jgi:hypothetical protein
MVILGGAEGNRGSPEQTQSFFSELCWLLFEFCDQKLVTAKSQIPSRVRKENQGRPCSIDSVNPHTDQIVDA